MGHQSCSLLLACHVAGAVNWVMYIGDVNAAVEVSHKNDGTGEVHRRSMPIAMLLGNFDGDFGTSARTTA